MSTGANWMQSNDGGGRRSSPSIATRARGNRRGNGGAFANRFRDRKRNRHQHCGCLEDHGVRRPSGPSGRGRVTGSEAVWSLAAKTNRLAISEVAAVNQWGRRKGYTWLTEKEEALDLHTLAGKPWNSHSASTLSDLPRRYGATHSTGPERPSPVDHSAK
ncbi:unnamed protein product [Heligmosomoides polygyrus]|uniref:Uncharacterized protein n=1 Tax=Heligmosomoides polygyrus TaxID=6339 RepID=A0A183G004_HELPZ|nr:unnamed protein product [Heligmosomoides polygyrus]